MYSPLSCQLDPDIYCSFPVKGRRTFPIERVRTIEKTDNRYTFWRHGNVGSLRSAGTTGRRLRPGTGASGCRSFRTLLNIVGDCYLTRHDRAPAPRLQAV